MLVGYSGLDLQQAALQLFDLNQDDLCGRGVIDMGITTHNTYGILHIKHDVNQAMPAYAADEFARLLVEILHSIAGLRPAESKIIS